MADSGGGAGSGLPPTLAAAVVVAVAGLAAVGLTGDALLRAVRNNPGQIARWLIIAVIAGGVLAVLQLWPKSVSPATPTKLVATRTDPHGALLDTTVAEPAPTPAPAQQSGRGIVAAVGSVIAALCVTALVAAVCVLIQLGAGAVSAKELPAVTLQVAAPVAAASGSVKGSPLQTGSMELTVTARAAGLSTKELLTVQVLGLRVYSGVSAEAVNLCESKEYNWSKGDNQQKPGPAEAKASLLLWNRVGPQADGTVDTSWKFQVPQGRYGGVCATVFGAENSAAYLRLK